MKCTRWPQHLWKAAERSYGGEQDNELQDLHWQALEMLDKLHTIGSETRSWRLHCTVSRWAAVAKFGIMLPVTHKPSSCGVIISVRSVKSGFKSSLEVIAGGASGLTAARVDAFHPSVSRISENGKLSVCKLPPSLVRV